MRLDRNSRLFIGLKADGKLRHAFETTESRGGYFDGDGAKGDSAGHFLTYFEVDGQTYLGKVVDGGISTASIDDVTRNVFSILRRMLRAERLPSALAIFAVED